MAALDRQSGPGDSPVATRRAASSADLGIRRTPARNVAEFFSVAIKFAPNADWDARTGAPGAAAITAAVGTAMPKPAIAPSSLRRWPTEVTPSADQVFRG